MSEFIRVRAANGPQHEFHAPVGEVEANPDLYEVIDPTPVSQPENPTYILPDQKPAKDPKPVGTPDKEKN